MLLVTGIDGNLPRLAPAPNEKACFVTLAGPGATFVGALGRAEGRPGWGFSIKTAFGIDRKAVIGGLFIRWPDPLEADADAKGFTTPGRSFSEEKIDLTEDGYMETVE